MDEDISAHRAVAAALVPELAAVWEADALWGRLGAICRSLLARLQARTPMDGAGADGRVRAAELECALAEYGAVLNLSSSWLARQIYTWVASLRPHELTVPRGCTDAARLHVAARRIAQLRWDGRALAGVIRDATVGLTDISDTTSPATAMDVAGRLDEAVARAGVAGAAMLSLADHIGEFLQAVPPPGGQREFTLAFAPDGGRAARLLAANGFADFSDSDGFSITFVRHA